VDFKALGARISSVRRAKKISQQVMADHLGMSRVTINALESGRAGDVGVRKVMRVVDYLGYELCLREKSAFPTLEELRDEQ
jgi:transcriptional regulator with XRE-family HTH domain